MSASRQRETAEKRAGRGEEATELGARKKPAG